MKPQTKSLVSGAIPNHIRELALPSSLGMFFQTMYNVVDSVYAGHISTIALAALGLSFPVYLLIIATSGGLSRGAAALIANAIGAEETDKQQLFVAQSLSLAILSAVTLMCAGFLSAAHLFRMLGAEGEYLLTALAYINPIFCGTLFFVLNSLSNAILIASGDSKTYSKVLVAGFFLNLVLDPWFLYGGLGVPAMGVAGIAWATVLIQFGSSMFMFSIVMRRGLLGLVSWRRLIPNWGAYWEIAQQAIPATFNIMSVAMGFFVTTYFLKSYGEEAVASFGVTTRIEQICLLPTIGLYAAIMALVGQNNGANRNDRIRETMWWCNWLGGAINVSVSLLIWTFARPLMHVFTDDETVVEIGVGCLRVIMLVQWSYVLTSIHLAMLQAIKRPAYGFFESISRKVLLPLPFLWLFVFRYDCSIDHVWYIIAGTNVFATTITIVYAQVVLRTKKDGSADSLTD